MIRPALATALLAVVSFFWFPGHTILQSDTQIYIPILERLADPSLFANDIMASRPHVRFTLYDEAAIVLRKLTGAGFEPVLMAQQFVYRALGIFGLYLLASAAGLSLARALAVAAIVSLGAFVNGPQVLTVEHEPVPRGFSFSFLLLSLGCAAQGWWKRAGVAAGIAWAWHPPTAMAYCGLLAGVLLWRRSWRALAWMGAAPLMVFLTLLGHPPTPDRLPLFGRLEPEIEALQRMRASYNWIGTWWPQWWTHYALLFAVAAAALARIWRSLEPEMRILLGGMLGTAVLAGPVSALLLDRWKLTLMAQVQPGRYMLYFAFLAALLGAIAAFRAMRYPEAAAFLLVPFALPLEPRLTDISGVRLALATGLALAAPLPRLALPVAALSFLLIPTVGGVRNYPALHTAELNDLARWARSATHKDAVFQFADIRRGLEAGVFRARALRAVYADWKAGGQVNFQHEFGKEWANRWRVVERVKPLGKYRELGIDYVVYTAGKQPAGTTPVFQNARWVVIATGAG
jgi:hypothetical protein